MSNFITVQHRVIKTTGNSQMRDKPQIAAVADSAFVTRKPKSSIRTERIRIVTFLHPDFKEAIRLVQTKTGENMRETVARALNTLFIEYNVPVVEEETCEDD